MKLVWHIIKKDLRAAWPIALGWLVLTALRIPLLLYILNSAGEGTMRFLSLVSSCAIGGDVLLIFTLARAVVHEDVLAGDKGFWITRPVSGGQLLAAKAISLFLICVVSPLVLLVPTWHGIGFGWPEISHVAFNHVMLNTGLVIVGVLFAVVTRQAGSFWMALVSTTVFLLFIVIATGSSGRIHIPEYLYDTRVRLASIFLAGLVLAGVVLQFLTRRARIAVGLFLSGAVGCFLLVGYWPVVIPLFNQGASRGKFVSQPAKIEWQRGVVSLWSNNTKDSLPDNAGSLLTITLPKEYDQIKLWMLQGQWVDAKGAINPAEVASGRSFLKGPRPSVSSRPTQNSDGTYSYAVPLTFGANWLRKQSQPWGQTSFSGKIQVEFSRVEKVADLKLVPGTKVRKSAFTTRLVKVEPYKKAVKITLVETAPSGVELKDPKLFDSNEHLVQCRSMSWYSIKPILWVQVVQRQVTYSTENSDPATPNQGRLTDEQGLLTGGVTGENFADRGWHIVKEADQSAGYCTYDLKADKLNIVKLYSP